MKLSVAADPTQEEVDQVAKSLAPDVVRIRVLVSEDWAGYPAVYFRTTLSDDASRPGRLFDVAKSVREALRNTLDLDNSNLSPYFRFRSQSEQDGLKDARWA